MLSTRKTIPYSQGWDIYTDTETTHKFNYTGGGGGSIITYILLPREKRSALMACCINVRGSANLFGSVYVTIVPQRFCEQAVNDKIVDAGLHAQKRPSLFAVNEERGIFSADLCGEDDLESLLRLLSSLVPLNKNTRDIIADVYAKSFLSGQRLSRLVYEKPYPKSSDVLKAGLPFFPSVPDNLLLFMHGNGHSYTTNLNFSRLLPLNLGSTLNQSSYMFDKFAMLILNADFQSVKKYYLGSFDTQEKVLKNQSIIENGMTYMMLAVLRDKIKVVKFFLQMGFDISTYNSCLCASYRSGDDSIVGNHGVISCDIVSMNPTPKSHVTEYNYLDSACSNEMRVLLLRNGSNPEGLTTRLFEAVTQNNFGFLEMLFRFNYNPGYKIVKYNQNKKYTFNHFNLTLMEYVVSCSIGLAKKGVNDFRMLRLILRNTGFIPEAMYDPNQATKPVAEILFLHNIKQMNKLRPKLHRPKIEAISLSCCGKVMMTDLLHDKVGMLTSKIISTADLYNGSRKSELDQVKALYSANFRPDDDTPEGREKHFRSKISPHREDHKFVELIMDGDTVASYFSFQILEQYDPKYGESILFFGLSAAVNKEYHRMGLATLVLRIPVAIQALYPNKKIFVLNKFLNDSYSFSTLPKDMRFFPRYHMNTALLNHLFAGTHETLLPGGVVLAKAKLICNYKPNPNAPVQREHASYTKGNKDVAVAAIFQTTKENIQELVKDQLGYIRYNAQNNTLTANAFCLFYNVHVENSNLKPTSSCHFKGDAMNSLSKM